MAEQVQTPVSELRAQQFHNLSAIQLKTDLPQFKAGDTVVVSSRITEGNKERVQDFEGVVIGVSGHGIRKTFVVRRMGAGGVGVERIFPLHSPNIVGIKVKTVGFVRRAKLYYLRKLTGRKAKIRDAVLKQQTEAGSRTAVKTKKRTRNKKKA